MKPFSEPLTASPGPTLDEQLIQAQSEYDEAVAKLHEMEALFDESAVAVTSDQFQRLESNLRQQQMITESKLRQTENLGKLVFEERAAAERAQAAAARAGQRALLLAKLDAITADMRRIEELKRVPLDHQLAILNSERSAILLELSTLKEEVNAA